MAFAVKEKVKEKVQEAAEMVKEKRGAVDTAMAIPENAPSLLYVGMTAGSIILSVILYAFKKKEDAIFVGHWAPTFLALGIFLKLVSGAERKQAQ